jgi:uncharacterized protein (TIGR03086 family)
MDAKQLFVAALKQATAVIDTVTYEDFTKPTPDTDWDVRQLAGHMLYELCWMPDMLAGKTIAEVGDAYDGDLIGDALQANWHAAAERACDALARAPLDKMVHTSFGAITADEYIRQAGSDQLIHAWDLGEGIGAPVQFDATLASAVNEYMLPQIKDWQEAGLFAPAVVVPGTADVQTKLLALTGRRVNWPTM